MEATDAEAEAMVAGMVVAEMGMVVEERALAAAVRVRAAEVREAERAMRHSAAVEFLRWRRRRSLHTRTQAR